VAATLEIWAGVAEITSSTVRTGAAGGEGTAGLTSTVVTLAVCVLGTAVAVTIGRTAADSELVCVRCVAGSRAGGGVSVGCLSNVRDVKLGGNSRYDAFITREITDLIVCVAVGEATITVVVDVEVTSTVLIVVAGTTEVYVTNLFIVSK